MRRSFPSLFRLIACLLIMTIMNSGMAMALYVCPQQTVEPAQARAMAGMPCAGMDMDKPIQCAEYQSAAKVAHDHAGNAPDLVPVSIAFIIPAATPVVPPQLALAWTDTVTPAGTDPPYLRTQRLRI
ncbi:hypothetical protein H3H37_05405 [Duganella sp. LX20W]|uniref:Uncharacterized protein n=1 Tax=Rugamonas brunnea TaxID=2758569 RepID=A0A7W2EPZ1_9BURK|nr:hypothetical protein [Rugamonas brunnea]MBA5636487.1 hypothetical protein [Rugamonas brunnea]